MTRLLFGIVLLTILLFVCIFNTSRIEFFLNKKYGVDNVDGCVYINLENRRDRKKLLVEELKKMKIPIKKIHKVAGIYMPKNGHKGCIQSHILALTIAKMNDWQNTLILEDDAELTISPNDFQKQINKIFNYLQDKSWDVIILSKANEKLKDLEDNKEMDIKQVITSTLATAYIIKNNYLQTLIDLLKNGNKKMPENMWKKDGNYKHQYNTIDQILNQLQKKDKWFVFKMI